MTHHRHEAQFIKSARESVGLSQRELAEKLGYSTGQFISNMERGLCSLPLNKMKKLCKLTKSHLCDLADVKQYDFKNSLEKWTK